MNRKDMIRFLNEKVYPLIPACAVTVSKPHEIINLISWWRVKNHVQKDAEMIPEVKDGFLFLNGKPAGRIAAKYPRVYVGEYAEYWEGKCIGYGPE